MESIRFFQLLIFFKVTLKFLHLKRTKMSVLIIPIKQLTILV